MENQKHKKTDEKRILSKYALKITPSWHNLKIPANMFRLYGKLAVFFLLLFD